MREGIRKGLAHTLQRNCSYKTMKGMVLTSLGPNCEREKEEKRLAMRKEDKQAVSCSGLRFDAQQN